MPARWADEISGTDPLPVLEPFYVLAALELGDPDTHGWLMNCSPRFHDLYDTYFKTMNDGKRHNRLNLPTDGAEVLIQYMIWYSREKYKLAHS